MGVIATLLGATVLLAPAAPSALPQQTAPATPHAAPQAQVLDAQPDGPDLGSLFGTVLTRDGSEYRGYIRWDRNEAAWADILHASKVLPERNFQEAVDLGLEPDAPESREIEIFGIKIPLGERGGWSAEALSAVRFGHVRTIEVLDEDWAVVVLKSGMELEMFASSTDLGSGIREIVVEDPDRGAVTLSWSDIELVDFASADGPPPSSRGQRLYGRLTTQGGDAFTGFIGWDNDEVFGSDMLDGERGGNDVEIPFGDVAVIEQDGRDGAMVTLRSGETFRLEDSNDVNGDNRGIVVSDPELGQVMVSWDQFAGLGFFAPPPMDFYQAFDGGRSLFGTVRTIHGAMLTGYLRWDNDEEFTWEILDGEGRGVEFDIEFAHIARIERIDNGSAQVVLLDGRSFLLEASNDVNEENKGIFVVDEAGNVDVVPWEELEGVSFRNARGPSAG
jgi:hypothetical protein